jgi:hypothetical protein
MPNMGELETSKGGKPSREPNNGRRRRTRGVIVSPGSGLSDGLDYLVFRASLALWGQTRAESSTRSRSESMESRLRDHSMYGDVVHDFLTEQG